jgi:hypothetical protein
LAPPSSPASGTAIALTAIATTAEVENSAAAGAVTLTNAKKTICLGHLLNSTAHTNTIPLTSDDRQMIAPAAQMISSSTIPASVQISTFSNERRQHIPRPNRALIYLGACVIAGLRLARERQVNMRVVPTRTAVEESVDMAHEIFNSVFRKVPQKIERQ